MPKGSVRRVIILGNSGFIGKQVEHLLNERASDIEIVGKSFPEFDMTKSTDVRELGGLMDQTTVIIFCSGIKKQLGDSLDIFSQNMQMALNLCEVIRERPVCRLIYLSSAEVYGEDVENTSINEKTSACPVSYYGVAKFASEGILQKTISGLGSTTLAILRPPLIYGMGDLSKGYGPTRFTWAGAANQEITLWGDGSELREFVCIDDLANIIVQLAFHDYNGVLNIATGKPHNFKEALDILAALLPFPLRISSRSRSKAKVDQVYDNSLLMKILPGFKFTPLEDGIKQMLLDMQKQIVTK